jgi:AcrR family transcriptional regulator
MAKAVKTRSYNSPRRREQALATRRAILDAAQPLFEQQGYVATTIAAIAREAGVAVKTVHLAFETKSGVLRALWNLRLRGDQEDVPVAARPWYREVLEEPDPERQLRTNAHNAVGVKTRVGTLLGVIRTAAAADPDVAELWQRIQSDFYENQRAVVKSLHAKDALKPGLDVRHATDILWTLNHPDIWLLLAAERGWSAKRFERWLGDAFCSELLSPRAASAGRSA